MKHVVITGADGFIGSHLTKHFIAHNYFVYAIVSPMSQTTHRIQDLEHVCVIAEDLNNYAAISKKIPDSPIAFFHLAWAGVSPEERQSTIFQAEKYFSLPLCRSTCSSFTCETIYFPRIYPGIQLLWSAD